MDYPELFSKRSLVLKPDYPPLALMDHKGLKG